MTTWIIHKSAKKDRWTHICFCEFFSLLVCLCPHQFKATLIQFSVRNPHLFNEFARFQIDEQILKIRKFSVLNCFNETLKTFRLFLKNLKFYVILVFNTARSLKLLIRQNYEHLDFKLDLLNDSVFASTPKKTLSLDYFENHFGKQNHRPRIFFLLPNKISNHISMWNDKIETANDTRKNPKE